MNTSLHQQSVLSPCRQTVHTLERIKNEPTGALVYFTDAIKRFLNARIALEHYIRRLFDLNLGCVAAIGDFPMYRESPSEIIPWCFLRHVSALGSQNERWVSTGEL